MDLKSFDEPVYVTRPFLPPLQEYVHGLRAIWDSAWLTNSGPVLAQYLRALEEHLGHANPCLFVNGTLALQIALEGLRLKGEVITTPFTFAATAHAAWWSRLRPVFVDIEPDYYTLDPAAVEAAVTPEACAILAVHVFGHPCRLEALADVARRHRLKLIYDAAHAFGVSINGQSVAHFGDVSMFSFHATKPYHSIEGGLLAFADSSLKDTFNPLKNFGIVSETEVLGLGANAKMNEFQALMGLKVLPHLKETIAARARVGQVYRERLSETPGLRLTPPLPAGTEGNHAYQPVEVVEGEAGRSRDALHERLKQYNIFTRRYFYPLLTDCPLYRSSRRWGDLPVARRTARRILTLPIYHGLPLDSVQRICDILVRIVTA
jgi:dTDP-4-amino-4,6-dideoxygalactose transaminase